MAKRGRPRKQLVLPDKKIGRVPRFGIRLCFSSDAIWCGDKEYRLWTETDDSGYSWSGQFDIVTKDQLKERIAAARSLGIPVFQKFNYGNVEEHEMYEIVTRIEDVVTN